MKKALLISKVDVEDLWVSGGLAFVVPDEITTYTKAVALLMDKLTSPETIQFLVKELYLSEDQGITSDYKITDLRCCGSLIYTFSDGETDKELSLNVDFITLVD